MLDASVVEEYLPGVGCIVVDLFVAAQRSFGMQGLVVLGESEACILGAYLLVA